LTREKLELGQEIPIQVELPTREKVVIHTKVMWCNPTNKMDEYRVGVKINEKMTGGESKFVQFYSDRLKAFSKR
jgi:Tfp pilus assembly protein PilZ